MQILRVMMMTTVAVMSQAMAYDTVVNNVDKHIATALIKKFPRTTIRAISNTDIPGIYEVLAGNKIIYSNATGSRVIIGRMVDTDTNSDLTQLRLDELKSRRDKVSFKDIPFQSAIKVNKSKGRKLVVFTDPDCGWCRKLNSEIGQLKGVEVLEILFPRPPRTDATYRKSAKIWCSKNRSKALKNAYHDKYNKSATINCDKDYLDKGIAFADKQGFVGTPMLVREDGSVIAGYRSTNELLVWLNALANKGEKQK